MLGGKTNSYQRKIPEKNEGKINNHSDKILSLTSILENRIKENNNKIDAITADIKNNIKSISEKNKIVSYDEKTFKIMDGLNIRTTFTLKQLIKFIGNKVSPLFLKDISSGFSTKEIIEYIGDITIDNHIIVNLKTPSESLFMGDINILIQMNNDLFLYEKDELEKDLIEISDLKIRKKIRLAIKQFIYVLLNHTLKVISIISGEIKNDMNKKELKDKLLRYSVMILYRISTFVKDYIDVNMETIDKLNNNIDRLIDVRKKILNKLEGSSTKNTDGNSSDNNSGDNNSDDNNSSDNNSSGSNISSKKTEKYKLKNNSKNVEISSINISELFNNAKDDNDTNNSNNNYYISESESDTDIKDLSSVSEKNNKKNNKKKENDSDESAIL